MVKSIPGQSEKIPVKYVTILQPTLFSFALSILKTKRETTNKVQNTVACLSCSAYRSIIRIWSGIFMACGQWGASWKYRIQKISEEKRGKIESELERGLAERRLTPRECALIQTFPPDYEFVIENKNRKGSYIVSPSQAYKIIGNAVPPLLAYNLAKRIEEVWDLYFNDDSNGSIR